MKVYVAAYSSRKYGDSLTVHETEQGAINRVIAWASDESPIKSDLDREGVTEAQARESLEEMGCLNLDRVEMYYSVTDYEVEP